ncbi:IgGFc-binding protein [Enhygromyxa salina]|uniref:IgGFc-binding protein n=1 Tax=Enhygromyxa salina TaxID=215803 RepID=UPI0015E5CC5B|nr:IgGFc-binding protein [Enhygromyxa salina]
MTLACSGGAQTESSSRGEGISQGETGITGDGDAGDGDGETNPGDGETNPGDGDDEPGTGDGDGDDDDDDDDDGDDGEAKFDLSELPDAGGGPILPTIPETCDQALMIASTVGCEFHANKMQNFVEEPSSLVVGNVSDENVASINIYIGSGGNEQLVAGPIDVQPGGTYEYVMDTPGEPGGVSVHRIGGAHKVVSDRPIVAYQHSPIMAEAHNDSSMLIPDHAQGQNYIAATYTHNVSGPPYFNVVGIYDNTTVTWEPRQATAAGTGVPAVPAFGMGEVVIDAYDMLQVVSSTDMSGTIITTSEPAWVVAAMPCTNVPNGVTFCDHIEEQLLPLEYWGMEYVGAHAPQRGNESYYWRVFSGADAVTVTTDPPQAMTPALLDRGEFIEFSTQESFIITADGPFMPVQYLEGQNGGAGTGDPASYQMVPTEQFLPRYVFVTGSGYDLNYVQVTRPQGGADVFVDDVLVEGYESVGAYEVSDWAISPGAHVADSAEPFGVTQVGYTNVTSYAYPGGLRLEQINPNPQG